MEPSEYKTVDISELDEHNRRLVMELAGGPLLADPESNTATVYVELSRVVTEKCRVVTEKCRVVVTRGQLMDVVN